MANIFVSYNRQSKESVTTLANDIEKLGHAVWFDQELCGGQVWWDQILARIRSCDVLVVALDPKALNSTACKREYGYAADLGKPIVPVLVSEGVSTNLLPPALSQIQFVDYRRPDRDAALRLGRAFTPVPPSKPLPDPLPLPPKAPISYLGGLTEQVETTSTLSYEQQSALMIDLRSGFRDPETTNDARTLLERLRTRHDLLAIIAKEIDELLGSPRQASAVPPRTSAPKPPPIVDAPERTDTPPPPTATHIMTLRERGLGAILGSAVGVVLGAIAEGLTEGFYNAADLLAAAVWIGTAGAITGAISGTHRRVIVIALTGLVLGFSIWAMVASDVGSAWALGAPIGAILGAIYGAFIKKKKGWT